MEAPTGRQELRARRQAEAVRIEIEQRESRARTLAKRIQQRRANDAAMEITHTGHGCTAATERCPEARHPLLDTPECCKAHIRRIMADLARLMDRDGIRWWVDYGTLLGYVRNGGLIRYDKDGDLGVFGEDREKLLALQPELLAMGYHATFAPPRPTQRFRTGDRMKVRISNRNHTNVDIFIWYPDKPKKGYLDRKNYIGADMYKGREFPMDWAFPLARGEWDGIDVSIPAEPEKLAAHRYGPTWQEEKREKHPPEARP
jgi:hypothetical protein